MSEKSTWNLVLNDFPPVSDNNSLVMCSIIGKFWTRSIWTSHIHLTHSYFVTVQTRSIDLVLKKRMSRISGNVALNENKSIWHTFKLIYWSQCEVTCYGFDILQYIYNWIPCCILSSNYVRNLCSFHTKIIIYVCKIIQNQCSLFFRQKL